MLSIYICISFILLSWDYVAYSFHPSFFQAKSLNKLRMQSTNDLDSLNQIFDDQTRTRELISALITSKRSYNEILTERFAQTIDDFQLSSKIKKLTKEVESDPLLKEVIANRKREKIVILGTGWASYSLCKSLDSEIYDVVVISPRNYFLFTPMLAASSVGTVEFKSICDPIRNVNPFVDYLEASAVEVLSANNTVRCEARQCVGTSCESIEFDVQYDYLVIAVGANTNTYGIKVSFLR
jgi:hypothetical protein